jgi:hypothetical protein
VQGKKIVKEHNARCIRLCGIGLVVPLLIVSSCFEEVGTAPESAACGDSTRRGYGRGARC